LMNWRARDVGDIQFKVRSLWSQSKVITHPLAMGCDL